jgi:hypothetical protein
VWDDHNTLSGHAEHYQADKDTTILIVSYKPDNPEKKKTIIQEVMASPVSVPDPQGEWFEIYNADSLAVDIEGWTIESGDSSHVINSGGPLVIQPNDIVVLARDAAALALEGFDVFYEYGSDITLGLGVDDIKLRNGGALEDSVAWDTGSGWPGEAGASIQWLGEGDNSAPGGWQAGGGPTFGSGDGGTPGEANYVFEPTGIENTRITRTELKQNYPNPFNPITTIPFALARHEGVTVVIYDVQGRVVRRLLDRILPPGEYRPTWDGENDHGARVATGVYFYRLLTASGFVQTRKMVLLK